MTQDESQDRAFKGIWIPAEIWLDQGLSIAAKCLLAEISSLDKGEGCYASNEHFANFLGIKVSAVQKLLQLLREKKLIETVKFDGRTRWISTKFDVEIRNQDIENFTPQTCKNLHVCHVKNSTSDVENFTPIDNSIEYSVEQSLETPSNSPKGAKERSGKKQATSNDFSDAVKSESPEVVNALRDFYAFRQQIKKPLTAIGLQRAVHLLNKLATNDKEKLAIIDQSITHNWIGLFGLKDSSASQPKGKLLSANDNVLDMLY